MTAHSIALLPVRASVGSAMTFHGTQKLSHAFGGSGLPATERMLESLEIRPSRFWARALAWTELLGGASLLAGVFVRPAAAAIAISQAVAIWKVHARHGFEAMKGGYEYNLALIAGALLLLVEGAGDVAVGSAIRARWTRPPWRRRLLEASESLRLAATRRPVLRRLLEASL